MVNSARTDARRRLMALLNPPPKQPNWELWKTVPSAPLWEVVALSCNVAPSDAQKWLDPTGRTHESEDFITRLHRAVDACMKSSLKSVAVAGENHRYWLIKLGDFYEWCESHDLPIPPDFPASLGTQDRNALIFKRYKEYVRSYGKERGAYTALAKEFQMSRQAVTKIVKCFKAKTANQ